ncbi:putative peptidoglycan lipid II flippase [Actinoplanes lutulentus]|uniref:Putative peptidoglycan lipid II flippase n=1 Tax=Actinoplanes lutulentus TaxID=1287878 RepID=A0A327Z908_9ACTN|nr:murein biosynthesis integral membrane protein MurJ [Actinoplanes lutulentus]MBB2944780.1 putative peptidoglycan lipid II flippase [Actinoplanes lutulentus]RAK35426.1 putative peptidoglycan lipid II flippase [Actinoplanes lutulentus]
MNGGLYRSTHATPDDQQPPAEDGVTVISVDAEIPGGDQALPPEQVPPTQGSDAQGSGDGGTAGQSAIMAIGSLVSRVIGFVRNALIGMTLGAGVGDAYTSAQFLPGQIYELLLGGILSSVLIPLLVRRRKADPDGGQEFTQKLLTFAVTSLAIATALVVVAAPVITALQASDGNTEAYSGLVTSFAYLILPIIFFTGLSALIGAVLNVRGHFAAPMWAPILNNIVVIATCGVFVLAFGTDGGLTPESITPAQIALIGGGTLLGMVVQAAGLLPALRKVGFRWKWRWDPRALGLREIGNLAGWMLCYVAANQVAVFVVVRILNEVAGKGSASVLAFNNVYLLTMMAHGIIGVSVMTALLPKMSAAAADGRYDEVSADLTRGIKLVSAALAPIAVVYGVLGDPLAVFLFQGGNFDNDAALDTGTVLTVSAFAVLPLSISYLCTYAFYSLQGNKTVALINIPVVAVRIGAYFALAAILSESLSAAGMTAANAVSYLASAVISLTVLRRKIGRLDLGSVAVSLIKVIVAAAVAAGLGLLVVSLLPGAGEPDGRIEALVQLLAGGAVILVAYLAAALGLRVQEISQVVGMVRRKLGR